MYSPEIMADRVREIRTEVARTTATRIHRSVAERIRAIRDLAAR